MGTKTQKLSNVVDSIVQWQSVVTADGSTGLTAVAGRGYFINTTSGTITVTLPGSAKVGDTIALKDYAGTWGTNNVTISSTLKISGADADGTLSTNNTTVTIVYMDTTKGWTPIQNSTQSALATDPAYVTATGGTVTTSGDYKIHTFTGDGCFVVSCGGNPTGNDKVDYLVVAGGGGGQTKNAYGSVSPVCRYAQGAGGAGGFRESHATAVSGCYTASPIASGTSLTVTATTYPITVGAGGASPAVPNACSTASPGSNSIFSTITSAGGGGGGSGNYNNGSVGANGGSGGGGGASNSGPTPICGVSYWPGGTGNTPPTSPPQGNPGGGGNSNAQTSAGGGGGATTAGANGVGTPLAPSAVGGDGGAGGTTSISGTPTAYAGGGGGGAGYPGAGGPPVNVGGAGGSGGGGCGGGPPTAPRNATTNGVAGTANTGGGGGGAGGTGATGTCTGGSGGKGVVVIRYKFQ